MSDGIVAHIRTNVRTNLRTKPRTSALIGVAGLAAAALIIWNAGRGGSLYTYIPLLACLAMHGFMHGGHGKHGTSPHGSAQEISAQPAGPRTPAHEHD